jgi:hypothetical protein
LFAASRRSRKTCLCAQGTHVNRSGIRLGNRERTRDIEPTV